MMPKVSFFQFVRALPALMTLLKDSKPDATPDATPEPASKRRQLQVCLMRVQRQDDEGKTYLRTKPCCETRCLTDTAVRDGLLLEYLSERESTDGTTFYMVRHLLNVGFIKAEYCVRLTASDHIGGRKA